MSSVDRPVAPVIEPGHDYASVTDKIASIVVTRRTPRGWLFGATIAFMIRQIARRRQSLSINLPKIMFLISVCTLHIFVCYHPATLTAPLLGFGAMVTIFHDIQYHAIVWYYQKNRMAKAGDEARGKYGFAARLGRSFPMTTHRITTPSVRLCWPLPSVSPR